MNVMQNTEAANDDNYTPDTLEENIEEIRSEIPALQELCMDTLSKAKDVLTGQAEIINNVMGMANEMALERMFSQMKVSNTVAPGVNPAALGIAA